MADLVETWLRALLAVAILGPWAFAARRVAAHLAAGADGAARLAAWLTVGIGLGIAAFHLLAPWGLFTVPGGLLAFGLAAAGASRLEPVGPTLAEDLDAAWAEGGEALRGPTGGLFAAFGLATGWALVRALVAPPLGWDSLLYHMVLPAGWVQAGGLFELAAPDGWSLFRFFPAASEVLRAWAMLPFHSDLLANLAGWPGWVLAMAAAHALAGRLGADPVRRRLAALAVGTMPACLGLVNTAYVEVDLLATLLAGTLFLVRPAAPGELVLAGTALGAAAGMKLLALPVAGAAALGSLAGRPRGRELAAAAACFLALAAPWYLRTWARAGTPLHPWRVEVGGLVLGRPAPHGAWMVERLEAWADEARAADPWVGIRLLAGQAGLDPLDLGPAPVAAALLALFALARPGAWIPALLGLVFALGLCSAELRANLLHFPSIWGRFALYPAALALVLAAPAVPVRAGAAVVALGLWPAIPQGFGGSGGEELLARVLLLGLGLGPVLLARPAKEGRARAARPSHLLWLAGVAFLLLPVLDRARGTHRHELYEQVYEPLGFPTHAAGAWRACDLPGRPLALAVTAGPELMGLNWLWYPLLGTRLQNTLHYVPVTRDGRLIDGFDEGARAAAADPGAWEARLAAAGIDRLVCLWPMPLEDGWARARPGRFRPVAAGPGYRVYEVGAPDRR